MSDNKDNLFLKEAVQLAIQSVADGGGPFGAVIVKDGNIIGRGNNQVTLNNDPTAHAEVTAIRDACKNISDFNLLNSTLYASCEPCPMCMSAIYWARIDRVVYAATSDDASKAGFDDSLIAKELCKPYNERILPVEQQQCDLHTQSFDDWKKNSSKIKY
jgi:guanine deaminase